MRFLTQLAFAAVIVGAAGQAPRAGAAEAVGVVSHVKVLSDKVEDVSSLAAWKDSCIKPGMTDDQKAVAIWRTVVKYRHQTAPPNEYLQLARNVHDVMKMIHVYGYGMCCCAASHVEQLGRYVGFGARGWGIHAHSVPEVQYDGTWHLLDASLMNYFRTPDGAIASVADIGQAVGDWLDKNPKYRKNPGQLRAFARNEGWKKGPALLAGSEFYAKDGQNLAGTHGWPSTMQEFDAKRTKPFIFEYGYSQGYRPNVQLRPGERLTRNWSNKGLHVNMGKGGAPRIIKRRVGMGLQRKLGDIAPGRIGNGVREYDVPLADGAFRTGALKAENLAAKADDGKAPAVHVKDPGKPAVLILRMPSSYVYLTGELTFKAAVGGGGAVVVSFSDNNGLDWKEIARAAAGGDQKVDLKEHVFRRYDYRLKFEMRGKGTGLDALKVRHDVQHSQSPLPALGPGRNTITFSAGPDEGTVTVEGSTNPSVAGKQLLATDFHPVIEHLKTKNFRGADYGPKGGMVTFPVETPGEITRLRFGGHFRARDKREGWIMLASFDGGKTFKEAGRAPGPTPATCKYVTIEDVPAGTRKALVRYQTTRQRNTLCLFDFRIDADYRQPHGGFRPVQVTYVWQEGGAEKRDVHVARKARETYAVTCAAQPVMKSLIVELAE